MIDWFIYSVVGFRLLIFTAALLLMTITVIRRLH